MKILCDYHHGELYESILKLFGDRIGATVYRPIGREWFDENYWNISTNSDTIGQYLGYHYTSEIEPGLWVEDGTKQKEYYSEFIEIYGRKYPRKLITLPRAKEMRWDIIITTMLNHFIPMEEFRKKYCPSAKHIFQVGNMLPFMPAGVVNVMNSTASDCGDVPNQVNYYQEFDPTPLYVQFPVNAGKSLYTFLINNSGHRGADFMTLEKMMPNWIFAEYGAHNRDGNIHKYSEQCNRMREMAFMWHVKMNGDGYGYSLYRALFAGKPVILNYSTVYQYHRLATLGFFKEGENMVNYDGKTLEQVRDAVLKMNDNWVKLSSQIARGIRELIDFDQEEMKVRKFLENLR